MKKKSKNEMVVDRILKAAKEARQGKVIGENEFLAQIASARKKQKGEFLSHKKAWKRKR